MKKILVIGSLNMDFVLDVEKAPEAGETVRANSFTLIPGGKGANQAYAVGKLGGCVKMLGAVGNDSNGDALLNSLASVGVDTSCIRRAENAMTGVAAICVDADGENRIIAAGGANLCADIDYIRANEAAIEWCDILLLQLEIPLEAVVFAARRAYELGKMVILDPAPARTDLPEELLQYLYLIKPNETEVLTVRNYAEKNVGDAAAALLKLGVDNVLVTLGDEGSRLYRKGCPVAAIPTRKVKAVDTTAAGDCFAAALSVALARGERLEDAAAYASRAASVSVTRKGAQTSIPSPNEVPEQ